jgi:hypothetical protein
MIYESITLRLESRIATRQFAPIGAVNIRRMQGVVKCETSAVVGMGESGSVGGHCGTKA